MANIRQVIFDRLANDSVLNGLGFNEENIFNSNDVDTPIVRPFMVLRWGLTTEGMDVVRVRSLTVWIHDQPSDYSLIDSGLERVRAILTNVIGTYTGDDDKWVLQIDWTGDSEDLSDDVQTTITRNSSYSVVGSAV